MQFNFYSLIMVEKITTLPVVRNNHSSLEKFCVLQKQPELFVGLGAWFSETFPPDLHAAH